MSFQVENLTVSFPGVGTVLDGVNLALAPGRTLAIVGESGAGKSVFARALVGLACEGGSPAHLTADTLTVTGHDMRQASTRAWRALRGRKVGFVLQDALGSLDPLRTIGAQVGESLRIHRHLPRTQVAEQVVGALTQAGLPHAGLQARRYSWELSGGMRQRALIASAIISHPHLIIADEPTTALDATVAAGVLATLGELTNAGAALLLITHDLAAASRLADEVAVFDGGRLIEYGPAAKILTSPAHKVTRNLLAAVPRGPKPSGPPFPGPPSPGPPSPGPPSPGPASPGPPSPGPASSDPARPLLRARALTKSYRLPGGGKVQAVDDVDVDLKAREVLGIVGESGSGKTTLTRLLLGAEIPEGGEVTLAGEAWVPGPERARRNRRGLIRLVPQDPLGSFDPRLTTGEILTDALRRAAQPLTPASLLEAVSLDPQVLGRRPRSLSGGMRQRVAIARALATDPKLLILDEPVSALDLTVQRSILDLLTGLQRDRGMAMVFVSHDLAVVRQVSDRVAVMAAGRIVEHGPTEQVWAHPSHQVTRALLTAAHNGHRYGFRL